MSKIRLIIVLLLALCVQLTYSQKKETAQAAEKTAFLAKAPAHVQEYYRVYDSLAQPTEREWAYKKWSINELKKYASMIYNANEYDPIAKEKFDLIRYKAAKDVKRGWVTNDIHVISEIRKRISEKHAAIIKEPYWLTIVVDQIITSPYTVADIPGAQLTEKKIQGRVIEVWKGNKYKVGDPMTCYYYTAWNYKGLVKGNSYIVALCPIVEDDTPNEIMYALGGPNCVQRSAFPIENGFVIDEDNLFQLGKKVEFGKFTSALTSTINEIKLWKEIER